MITLASLAQEAQQLTEAQAPTPSDDDFSYGDDLKTHMGLQSQIDAAKETLKDLESQLEKVSNRILAYLDARDTTRTDTHGIVASIGVDQWPSISDYTAFSTYVIENEALHLLHRRLAVTALAAADAMGEKVPGITYTPRRKLSVKPAKPKRSRR